jgi:hypothetical protein
MAAIFTRLAYAGIAIAAVGGIAKGSLYNGLLTFSVPLSSDIIKLSFL